MTKQVFIIIFLTIYQSLSTFAQKQDVIKLDNASFEDVPHIGHAPAGWTNCGFAGETPPDVNPAPQFKVTKKAYQGDTYVGLVTRDNNTWEAVGQKLKTPLLKGVTYSFSIYLAQSETFVSPSRLTGRDVNYIKPIMVRIWAGSGYCSKDEMLGQTALIAEANWRKFSFKFTPKMTHNYFSIEAFYKVPTLFPYNGHVLVDNASDIVPEETSPTLDTNNEKQDIKLPKLPIIAIAEPFNETTITTPSVELRATVENIDDKSQITITFNGGKLSLFEFDRNRGLLKSNLYLNQGVNTISIQVKNKKGSAVASTTVHYETPVTKTSDKPVVVVEKLSNKLDVLFPPIKLSDSIVVNGKVLKEGSIIKIDKLQFSPNSADIERGSYGSLDAVYNFLSANPNIIVEIGGHTNLIIEEGISILLSLNRAKAVANYLISKGIDKKRLVTKGYGKSAPLINGRDQAANKTNQRVEIKILSTNG